MNPNAVAKAIFDLMGIIALISSGILGLVFILVLGYSGVLLLATDETMANGGALLIFTLMPVLALMASLTVLFFCCRRHSRRLSTAAKEDTATVSVNPEQTFILLSGALGTILVLIVVTRLINDGDLRWARGLAVDDTQMPWLHFIDLGVYAVLGITLFARPRWLWLLWQRCQRAKDKESQS
ncbi:MAG: hypothetical protein EA401_00555 [Planctomycetota bacterium]|nr:MAG: hypothetical protein EA401_00555 [Planctomycetota bacterium]